jgi:hypothetical protein
MGYIIGIESTTPTWCHLRDVVNNFDVPTDPANPTVFGDYNREFPAGAKYLKTVEGNGLLRIRTEAGGPEIDFSEQTAPIEDYFIAGGFVEPYPEDMVGRTVETSTSSFTLIIDAFDIGQTAGLGGTSPVTDMEWFENLT